MLLYTKKEIIYLYAKKDGDLGKFKNVFYNTFNFSYHTK